MDNLHKRIKSTRVSLGLSQANLAQKTGVSQPTVANWENGSHVPRQSVLEKIADVLNVSALWLLSGTREGDAIPASLYLQTPIRHVPIFRKSEVQKDFEASAPIGYFPYASLHVSLFGLMEQQDDTKAYTITICDPDAVRGLRDGHYLIALPSDVQKISMAELDRMKMANVLGRVIAEMTFYA